MAQRTVCLCGCGANLILVAGDRNLREQHFRLKDGAYENVCHIVAEGKTSVDSKIVLKCWLDEKLRMDEIETRVPISLLEDIKRKYEFSFLSRSRKIAVSYCHDRANLSDEKFKILEANSKNIHIIYIVDAMNSCGNGQYPEALMKIQNRQGYCFLLEVENASYSDAVMCAVFYTQDIDGLWREIKISEGCLRDYWIDDSSQVWYKNKMLTVLLREQIRNFEYLVRAERLRLPLLARNAAVS